jgi:hypothetical protein
VAILSEFSWSNIVFIVTPNQNIVYQEVIIKSFLLQLPSVPWITVYLIQILIPSLETKTYELHNFTDLLFVPRLKNIARQGIGLTVDLDDTEYILNQFQKEMHRFMGLIGVMATVVPNRIDNLSYDLTYNYQAMILQGKIHVLQWILNSTLLYRYLEIHRQWGFNYITSCLADY